MGYHHSFWKAWNGGVTKLYDKSVKIIDELPSIDLSNIMKKYRLRQLLKFIPHAFHGDNPKDPWNPVKALVEGFNSNRSQKVVASYVKVLDEMMSGWAPDTTRWGGLPFLSFVLRKPVPLGTELKAVADASTGK